MSAIRIPKTKFRRRKVDFKNTYCDICHKNLCKWIIVRIPIAICDELKCFEYVKLKYC